jgi:hypothetical protein
MSKRILYNITSANLQVTNISGGTISATNVSSANANVTTATVGNIRFNNNGSGLIWGNNFSRIYDDIDLHIFTDDNMYFHTTNTIGCVMFIGRTNGNVGIGTTNPSNTLDVSGIGRITTSLTTGAVYSTNVTSTNIVGTNVSSSTARITNLTTSTISSTVIAATTMTGGSLSLSGNLNVAGTLTTVNITSTNLVNTNVSAGVVVASTLLSATGNSNTIGNIFTTGGNVGINTLSPLSRLHLSTGNTHNNILFEPGYTSDGANPGWGSINFNGYYNSGEQRINSNKNRWRILTDQRSTSDSMAFDTFNGTTLTTLMSFATSGNVSISTLSNTNVVSTNVSAATLNLSTGLTSSSARISNAVVTNISSNNIIVDNNYILGAIQLGTGTGSTTSNINLYGPFTDGYGYIQAGSNTNTTNANLKFTRFGTLNGTLANFQVYSEKSAFLGGNVGIGTTNPIATLDINGNIRVPAGNRITSAPTDNFIYSSNTVGHYGLMWATDAGSGDGPMAYLSGYGGIRFFTFGLPRMIINSASGNVGIGTTNPQYTLDVNGVIASRNYVIVQSTAGNAASYYSNDNSVLGWSFGLDTDTSFKIKGGQGGGNQFTNNALAPTRLTINTAGSIGIGTTAPNIARSTTIPNARLSILTSGVENVYSRISLGGGAEHYSAIEGGHTSNGATTLALSTCLNVSTNSGLPLTRMFIQNNGNIGIGTTDPTYTLDVAGNFEVAHTLNSTWVPAHYMYNNSSTNNAGVLGLFTPNMGTNTIDPQLFVGRSIANGNCGMTTFQYFGSGNTANNMAFSMYGVDSDQLVLSYNTNVGINTTAPIEKLHVDGNIFLSTGGSLWITGNSDSSPNRLRLHQALTASFIDFAGGPLNIRSGTTGMSELVVITTSGNMGIGTAAPSYKLHVAGDIYATGNIIAYSDSKLKTNIQPITNALDTVNKLKGVSYTHIETNEDSIGLIAQDTMEVLPQVVATRGNYLGINYGNMVGLLVEAIKEMKSDYDNLKTDYDKLKRDLNL